MTSSTVRPKALIKYLHDKALDLLLDFGPGSAQFKGGIEVLFGINPVTGEHLTTLDRSISLVGILPCGKIFKYVRTTGGKLLFKYGDDVIDVGKRLDRGHDSVKIIRETDDGLKRVIDPPRVSVDPPSKPTKPGNGGPSGPGAGPGQPGSPSPGNGGQKPPGDGNKPPTTGGEDDFGGSPGRGKQPSSLTPAQALERWKADIARADAIAWQMRHRGYSTRDIAQWRAAAGQRAEGRLRRALDGESDTLPPYPAPWER